ncbi:MAG TPA: acyl-CoA dehydrogenase [Povalibacter sp.]|uniref:acyl-CoA dehydrogenase n=1 Tax=Povalibacter sp. TaxID=1962978 RepID=UPI002B6F287D|nr:acyl-CoA dehydrogenase [Povalibacter sp.]HMN46078.1 acyl-CoA dehydrogenase [Povalibacter sp.]
MNFQISEDQQMLRDTFARFLDENSSMSRVRAAQATGFDRELWRGLAELGAFSLRVPESAGGVGLGLLDAAVLMEEVGRTLASGPLAEALVAARLLAQIETPETSKLLEQVIAGEAVVTIAFNDIAREPVQWIAGGAVADAVIARDGEQIVLVGVSGKQRRGEPNLGFTPLAELHLADAQRTVVSKSDAGRNAFAQAIEEWKLLIAAALAGLSREAIRLAAAYACERAAFGQKIGTYQGISHPLADLVCDVDGGKYLTWKTIRDIADGREQAGAEISLTTWWSIDTAGRAVAQALHTFGGYGLTTEYDIHLYNLRAKAWPLVIGDPSRILEEAGRRLYAGEVAALPDAGAVGIDFDLGEEAHALAKEVHAFFEKTLTPELRAKAHYSFDGHDVGVHRKLAEAGLLFPAWPKEYGGRAAPPYAMNALHQAWEEVGWSSHAISTTGLVGAMIRLFGSEELKREVLTKIIAGEVVCSLGYSEPSCGSDVFAAQTRATRDGDEWRIDGSKMFTSGADIADYVLMLTRTNTEVPKHKGLTMFVVPLKSPGVSIQPVFTFQDERTNITYYDGVKVKDSYRLGPVDGGVKVMAGALEMEHGGGFSKSQRHMVHAAEDLCRQIQYRGKALIDDPVAQVRLARATVHTLLSEVIAYRAVWWAVQKQQNMAYGPMAKLFSSEKFLKDSADLLDLTAPHSLSKRNGPAGFLNQCYRHAQGTTIYGGTSEVHRSQIAERNLGLPRTRA